MSSLKTAVVILACGLPVPAVAQRITTALPNNGRSDAGAGVFMDFTAFVDLRITGFQFFPDSAAGSPVQIEIMLYPGGGYITNLGDPNGWVSHDMIMTTSVGPAPAATPVPLNNPIVLAVGETVGVYFINHASGGVRYTGIAGAPPQVMYVANELIFYSEHARGAPPFVGPLFAPRCFSGVIAYEQTSGCYADCDGSMALDIFDFLCFQDAFVQMSPYANCDGNTVLDIFDFLCFQDLFVSGCP